MAEMRKAFVSAVIIVAFTACSDGVTGVKTITGDWELRTVNGSSLPFTVSSSGSNKTEILDDVISFYEGFTFSETVHLRVTLNGQQSTVTNTETGAFSVFGTSVTLTGNSGALARRGLIEGNTMTLAENGQISAYKK